MVFTAYQGFNSRLYVMDAGGNVQQYHEYVNYRLQDMTVINNEVYVTDAFIPCVYKVDIFTGDIELVVHDLWLYYFYGLAWDGNYFYVAEWDINRYDINGEKDGSADFDEDVMGATFANGFYWMLNDEGQIKCWDFSGWPNLIEIPEQGFTPPTPDCRGLWFDGEYFFTAESLEGTLGFIYKFDFDGQVMNQWIAPAFEGWAACWIDAPVEIRENFKPSFEIEVFPNPAGDFLNIEMSIEDPSQVRFQLYDLSGNMIEEFMHAIKSANKSSIKWNFMSAPPTGNYILRVLNGSEEVRQLIVIQ